MRRLMTIIAMLSLCSAQTYAKIWTVDQRPGANFTTLSAAHTGAASGDTIVVSGSPVPYSSVTFTKKLVVLGPGYFLDENTNIQANTHPARISGNTTFSTGSSGSVMMGFHFISTVFINTDKITFSRNRVEIASTFSDAISIQTNVNDVLISQNYVTVHSGGIRCIYVGSQDTNLIIKNNYLEAQSGYGAIDASVAFTGEISNNVIYGTSASTMTISAGNFINNIIRSGKYSASGIIPYNNICADTTLKPWTDFGNQINVNMTSVFESSGTSDTKWKLSSTGGPASGTGFGGVDCGMYDNSTGSAYIPSGIPPIPSIYEFDASDLNNITVKVKSHN